MDQRGMCERISRAAHLDDEDEDGILGVINGGVGSLEDAALIGGSDNHGDSELLFVGAGGVGQRATGWDEDKEGREEKMYQSVRNGGRKVRY